MQWAQFLPDSDYRFQMRFERGAVQEFFRPTARQEQLLAERRHWLTLAPQTYGALLPEGIPLLLETLSLAENISPSAGQARRNNSLEPWERLLALGQSWEPDYLLLKPNEHGEVRLLGAVVCFPSSWDLADKMGRSIELIHEAVPGLNDQIGVQIHAFLTRLKPGPAWQRTNWGLSASPELNQHPQRRLRRLDERATLDTTWFRVERQALVALEKTGGILFAIRIEMCSLRELIQDPLAHQRLIRALSTMPDALAAYKGLASARFSILQQLHATGSAL